MKQTRSILILLLFLFLSSPLLAQEVLDVMARGRRLHLALTGTLPTKIQFQQTVELLNQSRAKEAALKIIQEDPNFYNVTLKSMVTPWSNKIGDHTQPLNDMTALMIGLVRDNIPFNQVFSGNRLYVFRGAYIGSTMSPSLRPLLTDPELIFSYIGSNFVRDPATGQMVYNPQTDIISINETPEVRYDRLFKTFPLSNKVVIKDPKNPSVRFIISRHSYSNNDHYEEAEALNLDFANVANLRSGYQTDYLVYTDTRAVSGILSTREFGKAYLQGGTNRAPISYLMSHMLCKTQDQVKDSTLSDEYVRKDIPRIPGGRETTFKNNCVSCHTGLDSLANAFSYHNFYNGRIEFRAAGTGVVPKLNTNIANDDTQIGAAVTDDYWVNFWRLSKNSDLGWPSDNFEGYGLKPLGLMLSQTKQFSSCMAQRVYEKVCLNNVRNLSSTEKLTVDSLSVSFEQNNFNMKDLFAETSVSCKE
ncbi:MAG TPA: hypothetical protein VNJ01_15180 [Bacteriovoracaceae bacterium]|nr:hypothetical protein [Bacteriovoracaceae bacterium]